MKKITIDDNFETLKIQPLDQPFENVNKNQSSFNSFSPTRVMDAIYPPSLNSPKTKTSFADLLPAISTQSPSKVFNFEKAIKSIISNSINKQLLPSTNLSVAKQIQNFDLFVASKQGLEKKYMIKTIFLNFPLFLQLI